MSVEKEIQANKRRPDYTTLEVARMFRVRTTTPREAFCRDGHWMGIRPIRLPSRRLLWPRDQVDAILSDAALAGQQPDISEEIMKEFDFGSALRCLRANGRVARRGWNGKGMFLVLVPGSHGLTVEEGRPLAKAGVPVGTKFNYLPHIDMFTAQGDFVPWLASQTDVLAQDWYAVGDGESTSATTPWSLTTDMISVGGGSICVRDKVTDGSKTETVQAIICGSGIVGPAFFMEPHPDGTPSQVLSVDQFVADGWRKVEAE